MSKKKEEKKNITKICQKISITEAEKVWEKMKDNEKEFEKFIREILIQYEEVESFARKEAKKGFTLITVKQLQDQNKLLTMKIEDMKSWILKLLKKE